MKVSRNWLQTYFEKPIPLADQLAELFTFHSFEVEGIEEHKGQNSKTADTVLDVKVLPDRAHYCLSHTGVSLEVAVLTGQPLKSGRLPPGPEASLTTKPTVEIEASKFCRRYMARYVELHASGSKLLASDPHACAMLEAIGERSINSVVDATNIVMFDTGQPLHAFDADQVKGTIVVRAARPGEKILLLDSSAGAGREVELLETDHVIADDLGPLAIAGVKGGKRAGITEATRRLIIESANFDPTAVRRTSTRLDLRSESSKRYENEITPELASSAMDNVCSMIAHNIPAAKFGPIVDEYPTTPRRTIIDFDPAYLEARLGVKVPLSEAKGILERMNISVVEKGKLWHLTIPFNRLDLTIKEDIVEEVGRIYGYDKIDGILPPRTDKPVAIEPMHYLCEKIRDILADHGFSEVNLYTLVAKGEIETAHPLAKDKAFARENLTDGMMACVEKNALNADLLGLDAIRIFEIGHTFSSKGEKTMLSLGFAQVKKVKGLKTIEIFDAFIKSLGTQLGVAIPESKIIQKANHIVCEIDLDHILASYKLPANASYKDFAGKPSSNRYTRFSLYPFIVRDIAVFVPESVQASDVWSAIEKGIADAKTAELLVRHSLFDTFKKGGKVSYAFRMVFQSMDRTLTDEEAGKIMEKAYTEVKEKGWEVR